MRTPRRDFVRAVSVGTLALCTGCAGIDVGDGKVSSGTVEVHDDSSSAHTVTITVERLSAPERSARTPTETPNRDERQYRITSSPGEAQSARLISEAGRYRVVAETETGESASTKISLSVAGERGEGLAGGMVAVFIESDGTLDVVTARD